MDGDDDDEDDHYDDNNDHNNDDDALGMGQAFSSFSLQSKSKHWVLFSVLQMFWSGFSSGFLPPYISYCNFRAFLIIVVILNPPSYF